MDVGERSEVEAQMELSATFLTDQVPVPIQEREPRGLERDDRPLERRRCDQQVDVVVGAQVR